MKRVNYKKHAKTVVALAVLAVYWYFVNQRIISDEGQVFGLPLLALLISASTAFFPLPANLIVLAGVKTYSALTVALVAGVGTLGAYFLEHIFFGTLFRFNKVASFKETWIYQKMSPLFERQKFLILAFTSFLPIPSEPLRIYAIGQGYSRILYMLAGCFGRIPRFFLLGYFGKDYVNSIWFIAAVFIFPGVFLVAIRGTVALVGWVQRKRAPALAPAANEDR